MKIEDAMTTEVTTVSPQTPLKDAAELLAEHHISGLPVVDEGRVVGIVSEADIVARSTGAPERRGIVAELLGGRRQEDHSAEAVLAGDAMSSPAITIGPGQPVSDAARLMVERKINRLPVVDDSQLVGIVTRADLVRAFVRPDAELEREIREDVAADALWIDPRRLVVEVEEGVVTLSGEVEQRADAELLERFTAAVPGVVAVRSELGWRLEDPKVPASDPRVPPPPRTR
ncbi:MAG TPA: CBS domain-containing protein [Gaiella sp.]|jgi:CBS domain-containing protein|nr:CBS domain-containing protein [Gaiella sp.]